MCQEKSHVSPKDDYKINLISGSIFFFMLKKNSFSTQRLICCVEKIPQTLHFQMRDFEECFILGPVIIYTLCVLHF